MTVYMLCQPNMLLQGRFLQCTKASSSFLHHFHEVCQVVRDGRQLCPHCGEPSSHVEVELEMPETAKVAVPKEVKQNKAA